MSAPIWYDNSETGAPVLNNAAGSLIALLRAVLINGFNVKAITSIAVAGGVATVTCPSHGYSSSYGKWIKITGANAPALDGVKQQTIVDADTFTYPAVGVADGSYTATDARRAPLDWTEPYSGTNKAIFARPDVESTAMLLRVVDTGSAPASATSAVWFGVESATGIDTYTAQFPTAAQLANGQFVWKGNNTVTAKKWAVVGDSRFLYLLVESTSASTQTVNFAYFGDFLSHKSVDPYACLIGGNTADSGGSANALQIGAVGEQPASSGSILARSSALTGSAVRASFVFLKWVTGSIGSSGPTYPSPVNGSFQFLRPVFIVEENAGSGHPVRGEVPGLAYPLGKDVAASFDLVTPVVGDGRTYFFARVGNAVSTSTHVMIDLTGPWR